MQKVIMYALCYQKQSTDSCEKVSDESDKTLTECSNNFQHCSCPYEGFDLCKECCSFWPYIEHHLKDIECQKDINFVHYGMFTSVV